LCARGKRGKGGGGGTRVCFLVPFQGESEGGEKKRKEGGKGEGPGGVATTILCETGIFGDYQKRATGKRQQKKRKRKRRIACARLYLMISHLKEEKRTPSSQSNRVGVGGRRGGKKKRGKERRPVPSSDVSLGKKKEGKKKREM